MSCAVQNPSPAQACWAVPGCARGGVCVFVRKAVAKDVAWPMWVARPRSRLVLLLLWCGWMGCAEGVHTPGIQTGCYLVCEILSLSMSKGLMSRNQLCSKTAAFFLLMGRIEHYPEMREQLCPTPTEVSGSHSRRCAVRAGMESPECFGMVLSPKLLHARRV